MFDAITVLGVGFGAILFAAAALWIRTWWRFHSAGFSKDVGACPKCLYAARGWRTDVCPECGTASNRTGVLVRRRSPLPIKLSLWGMAAPLVFIALLMGFSFLGETTTDMTYVTLTIQTPLKRVITPLDGFVPTRTDQIASIESRRQETRMPRRVTIITTTTVLLPTGNSREFTLGDGSEPPDLDAMKADFIFFRPRNLSDPEAPDPWAYSHTTAEQILDQARAVHTQTKPLHSPNQVGRTELHTSTTYVALWARIAMWTVPALIVGGLFVCISYHHRRGIMKVGLKHDAERRAT